MTDRRISAAEAEREFGVPARRVRVWAHRGKLFACALDSSGRPLYREADLRALICDTPKQRLPRQREPL